MRILYFLSALLFGAHLSTAQTNTPNGSGLPSGSLTGIVSYPLDFNQSPNSVPTTFNYTRKYIPLVPVTSISTFDNTAGQPILVETAFKDGFGNAVLDIKRTNHLTDIVIPFYNRPSKTAVQYLPFAAPMHSKFINNAFTYQKNYYNSLYNSEGYTAYAKVVSYSNAGQPTTVTYKPGAAYVGQERGTISTSDINTGGEVYKITYSGGNLCKNGTYPAGELSVSTTTGQNGQTSITYTDRSNRLLCKKAYAGLGSGNNGWLETYYVYNDMGKLIYVIPPKASIQFISNTCLTNINKLCFSYNYDKYGQITSKTTPGKTEADIVIYDNKHRPVLTQTPLLKDEKKYAFTIYDQRSRIVMSGILDNASYNYSDATWQSLVTSGVSSAPIVSYLHDGFSGTSYPGSITNCDIQLYNYYDSYANLPSPANGRTFDNSYANEYLTGPQMVIPEPYYFMFGKLVGSQTKITNTGNYPTNFKNLWITSVVFYDEKARVIQTQTLNPWNNTSWDVSTAQFDFSGNGVLTISKFHAWNTANKTASIIQVWNDYDYNTGILKETKQKIDQETWKTITRPYVNELGQVIKKRFGDVETQVFTYDIRGQLTGINANQFTSASLPQSMTFSERLNYESGFTERRYDGAISGFEWRTTGSHPSAYGYLYDSLGRMIKADYRDFNQATTPSSWNNTQRDFSVADIAYDENGNMKTMKQYGYDNSMAPALIDNLKYTYDAGNQLLQLSDSGAHSPIDDFDNTNGNLTSYTYDADGNLTGDALKGLSIFYNHQSLPVLVKKGNDSIKNVYDAIGTLLQKTVIESGNTTVWHYWGPYVYRNDSLLYVLHGEGRAKWLVDSGYFKYDYFAKDHLGNVRTVVTSDYTPLTQHYMATHEIASANIEESFFENLSDVRDDKPQGTPNDEECERLNGKEEERRIGASIILRVMAGDKFNVSAYSYHEPKEEDEIYTAPEYMMDALLTALAGGTGGFEGGEEENGTYLTQQLITSDNYAAYHDIKTAVTNPDNPRAYLNFLVFDEEFILDGEASRAVQVNGNSNSWQSLSLPTDIEIETSGYVLIYLSNEDDMDVFFDNLNILHHNGRLLEEEHYYPHGLLIKSTAANSDPENRYHYQGKELQTELGMQLYDFHARQYDPQIGRFWGIDPLDQFPSGYTGMANDPANNIDPSGMWSTTHNQWGQYRTADFYNYNMKFIEETQQLWLQSQSKVDIDFMNRALAARAADDATFFDEGLAKMAGNMNASMSQYEENKANSTLGEKNDEDELFGLAYFGDGTAAMGQNGETLASEDMIEDYKNDKSNENPAVLEKMLEDGASESLEHQEDMVNESCGNVYDEGMYNFDVTQPALLPEEGLGGAAGSYRVQGYVNVSQNENGCGYSAEVNVTRGFTAAQTAGNVDFFGTAELHVNGKMVESKTLQVSSPIMYETGTQPVGRASFNLPQYGGKVEMRIHTGYVFYNDNDRAVLPIPSRAHISVPVQILYRATQFNQR